MLVIGFVAQILDHRQLLRAPLYGDLLEHARARDLVGQLGNDHLAVLDLEARAGAEGAVAGRVDACKLVARRDDLGAGRQVGTGYQLADLRRRRLRFLKQLYAGSGDFAGVVRRDGGRRAARDPRGPVQQQVWQSCRQQYRLLERAVEIRRPVDGAVTELAERHLCLASELRLGVAHGRKRLWIVRRAEITLAVDERIAIGKRLRHQHQRLVARRVAVRVELADDVADCARRLLVLGRRRQPELAHRIDDAALSGLQAVADVRQRAIEDDVHRVVEVRLLREDLEREALYALKVERRLRTHAVPPGSADTVEARLPFRSSHSRRSEARFFASSMSTIWSACSLASRLRRT